MLGKVSVQFRAEQRKSLPGKAGVEDRGVEWGGQGSAWELCLPPTTYSAPTFQGLCGWAVGTQMLCQVTNAWETEAAAEAGARYLLSCRMYTARSPIPLLPHAVQGSAQRGMHIQAGVTLWFPTGSLPSMASIGLSCQKAGAELTWLITAATAWHTLSDIPKYGNTLFSSLLLFQGCDPISGPITGHLVVGVA